MMIVKHYLQNLCKLQNKVPVQNYELEGKSLDHSKFTAEHKTMSKSTTIRSKGPQ